MDELIWKTAGDARAWLDAANGTGDAELTCRLLKLTEEAGEAPPPGSACSATIGRLGVPRGWNVRFTRGLGR
ncbi:hypothetical protein [Micromonospora sp. CA-244673]|uniref:hypothetical protein n=1 Tax=Micromonospora sp. CA-244673 TaxID=3239958 RepID=UPI003D8CFFE0